MARLAGRLSPAGEIVAAGWRLAGWRANMPRAAGAGGPAGWCLLPLAEREKRGSRKTDGLSLAPLYIISVTHLREPKNSVDKYAKTW